MAYIDASTLHMDSLVEDLNELDRLCFYYRRNPNGPISMLYDGHFMEILREDAERRIAHLRRIRGIPPDEKNSTRPSRAGWHKGRERQRA